METPAVRTDFIQQKKKPSTSSLTKRKRGEGFLLAISIVVLIAALVGWGGAMVYELVLKRGQEEFKAELERRVQENVDITLIEDLRILDNRMVAAVDLLDGHTDLSLLFDFLERSTLSNTVRFSGFNFSSSMDPDGSMTYNVSMSGIASSFSSLSYQSTVLKNEDGIENLRLSDFVIDELTGDVSFNLTFDILGSLVSRSGNIES